MRYKKLKIEELEHLSPSELDEELFSFLKHNVLSTNYLKYINSIIKCGAGVNAKDNYDWTPLHWATHNKRIDLIKVLVAAGADLEARSIDRKPPMYYAVGEKYTLSLDIINLLLDYGCDINAIDYKGRNILHWAVYCGQSKLIGYFIEKGLSINSRDFENRTPLHLATILGYDSCVETLLRNGADLDLVDNHGNTSLDFAQDSNYRTIVKKLLKYSNNEKNISI